MHILDELNARGLIKDVTDREGLAARLDEGPITFYAGYDPTNTSLTVGNLVPIMLQAHLQRAGHKPIVLMGGGTALVGDPTGKSATREPLTPEDIERNLALQRPQFGRFIAFEDSAVQAVGGPDGPVAPHAATQDPALGATLVDNNDWLKELHFIPFLRDIGSQFSVNEMLTAETYATRLSNQQHLSFIEFNYRIVQAYDFLHLFRESGCELQVGGSDQWGNCVAGTELIRKVESGRAWVLTAPLLMTASGQKMGKTERGAVWLDPGRTSPFEYFQFWMNCDDRDVGRFLRIFTFLDLSTIEGVEAHIAERIHLAKARLAWEATALCHGAAAASKALATAMLLFDLGRYLTFGEVVPEGEARPAPDVPSATFERARLEEGVPVFRLFADVGLAGSGKQAKNLVSQGGAYVAGESATDPFATIGLDAVAEDGTLLLRAGKKKYLLLTVQ